jgi:hypothetical protein
MNLRYTARYLLHQLKAKNRHGLHSPFVYHLLDNLIYDYSDKIVYAELKKEADALLINGRATDRKPQNRKSRKKTQKFPEKVNRLLYRLTAHFKPGSVVFGNGVDCVTSLYCAAAPVVQQPRQDSAIVDALHENDLLIITHIHTSRQATANWQHLIQNPKLTVTIDLFYFGLAFCKPGQQKEHFRLRF